MSAVAAVPKVLPPPSPFGELLRRSRFASYDPAIRQAYTAPPSYIHRGNWGLKRPIANRHRKGHIVLRRFEEHAQFIEWDRADSQVKFIRRVEELGITPTLIPNSSWFRGLGQAAMNKASGLDSDFCPGESSEFERFPDERFADVGLVPPLDMPPHWTPSATELAAVGTTSEPIPDSTPILPFISASAAETSSASTSTPTPTLTPILPLRPRVDLDDLGKRGKGAYGAKAPPQKPRLQRSDETRLQPNINAMTPAEFAKYLEKLRTLRPHFLKYIREQLQRDRDANRRIMSSGRPNELTDQELVLTLGMEAKKKNLHMAFLGRWTEEHLYDGESEVAEVEAEAEDPQNAAARASAVAALANTPQPIRKQPHKFGGLVYAEPSELDTFYHVKPQPGFVLQDTRPSSGSYQVADAADGQYIAAFAGFTSYLSKKDAGGSAKPLYEPFTETGLQARRDVDPETGKVTFNTDDSERKMRMVSLKLEETPRAVGAATSNRPLSLAKLRSSVVVDNGVDQNFRDNPFTPGSREYSGLMPPSSKVPTKPAKTPAVSMNYFRKVPPPSGRLGSGTLALKGRLPGAATNWSLNENPDNSVVLGSLSKMVDAERRPLNSVGAARSEAKSDADSEGSEGSKAN